MWHDARMSPPIVEVSPSGSASPGPSSTARLIRRRAREELIREIVETARRQLATEGAAGLSLRAVARELQMVSSAVYRYVASRDELLTLLIVEADDSLGAAAEAAEARVDREDLAGRFRAVGLAVRRWALKHPHEYALIYGSPVPGYRAPDVTVGPASRVPRLLVALLEDMLAAGVRIPGRSGAPDPRLHRALAPIRDFAGSQVPDEVLLRGLMSWTHVLGTISAELFGHRHNVIAEAISLREAFYEAELARLNDLMGLADTAP